MDLGIEPTGRMRIQVQRDIEALPGVEPPAGRENETSRGVRQKPAVFPAQGHLQR